MKFTKKVVCKLNRAYSCAPLRYRGQDCILAASEKNDSCLLFASNGRLLDTIWTSVGGTMSIEQLPKHDGHFIAIQKFYSPTESQDAQLVYVYPEDGVWRVRLIAPLPFVHRFAILRSNGRTFLLAATLKTRQSDENPWLEDGKLWAAELPDFESFHRNCRLEMKPILEGLKKNHGFLKQEMADGDHAFVCAENGVFRVAPPKSESSSWEIEQILKQPASDIGLVDLDSDGMDEMIIFSPFHGDVLRVYKKDIHGYTCVFEQNHLDFLHAIWGGHFHGVPMALIGHRQNGGRLYALTYNCGSYALDIIDSGCGPSNVGVFKIDGSDTIWAMNCETNEIAMYSCAH